MENITKSLRMQNIRYDVRGPVLDEAERLMARGESIIQLNTGNPGAFGFPAPDNVLDAVRENLARATPYSQSKGLPQAREAVARHFGEIGIAGVTANDVFLGNGVSELIHMSLQALLNEGDEVLLPTPDYPLWSATTGLYGGRAVYYTCDEANHWYPDIEDIKRKVTAKTKAIVVINPNNPTGVVYSKEICKQIAEVARQNDLIILADEIYESLVMDGKPHTPMAALAPDLFVATFGGLSKSHNLAGYRVGWMCLCGRHDLAGDYITGLNMIASMRLCSNVPAQHAIIPALENYDLTKSMLQPGGRIYEQRQCIVEAIDDIPGLSAVRPDASFYIFPKLDAEMFNIHDDEQFVLDFLREKKVLLVNGKGFNWKDPDHFRIVYLPELTQLRQVATRLKEFLADYRQ